MPPGEDQVLIGDTERTRLKKIKALFFVGVNEGIVPRPVQGRGILSEPDREKLSAMRIRLAPTARETICQQRFYLYLQVTKPAERLFLSYACAAGDGTALLPSRILEEFRRLFPDMTVRKMGRTLPARDLFETAPGRAGCLLSGMQEIRERMPDHPFFILVRHLAGTEDGRRQVRRLLDAAQERNAESGIGRKLAETLYGRHLVSSVTRLEEFAGCAFRHFADYGLRLREREEYVFTPADFGTVMHAALEKFAGKLREEGLDWKALTDEDRERIACAALDEITPSYRNTILTSSSGNTYRTGRIRQMLLRTVWALQEQIRRGDFAPSAYEFSFLQSGSPARYGLSGGADILLTGKIDRLDESRRGDTLYLKVIDYKTGAKQLDPGALKEGLQLQLFVYLAAALRDRQRHEPELRVQPAGVFYYHVDDPFLTEGDSGEEDLLKKLRPDGLCRAEPEILAMLDGQLAKGGHSAVIPVNVNKDGSLGKASRAAKGEDFSAILAYTDRKVRELGERILSGETGARPYRRDDRTACDYCPYRGVCGFDDRTDSADYRIIRKQETEDLLRQIREEEQTWQ